MTKKASSHRATRTAKQQSKPLATGRSRTTPPPERQRLSSVRREPTENNGCRTGAAQAMNRKESVLREIERRFRAFVEKTSDGGWEIDEHAVFTYVSPNICKILGYKSEEVLGKTPFELMPDEEARRSRDLLDPIMTAQESFSCMESVYLHKDGRRIILECGGVP